MTAPPLLREGGPEDVEAMTALITSEGMPAIEVEPERHKFWVLEDDGRVLGCVGIELYGQTAVLRSLVVDPALRGTGGGLRLTLHGLDYARGGGAKRCYLFTMTAEPFFARLGFERVTLDDFEPAARESWQWRGVSEHEQLRGILIPMRLTLPSI